MTSSKLKLSKANGTLRCPRCWSHKVRSAGLVGDVASKIRCTICDHVFMFYWGEPMAEDES